jgi:hypothetical protein
LRGCEAFAVGFLIGETQRVGRRKAFVELLKFSVQENRHSGARVYPEMMVALRTALQVFLKALFPDDLVATFTLKPKTFGLDLAFFSVGRTLCPRMFS